MSINPLDGTDISATGDYTSNLAFINIDTKSLADQAKGTYYGSPKLNDYLVGETSGAVAKVSNKDMITDKQGKILEVHSLLTHQTLRVILSLKQELNYSDLAILQPMIKPLVYRIQVVKQNLVHLVFYKLHKKLLYL